MSDKAAITASLVDVRNIAAHKCVRLELHVPAEQAPLVMQAFGWPTMVDPVPVAVARLANVTSIKPHQEKRRRENFSSAMLAGYRCTQPAFWRYLSETFNCAVPGEEEAAHIVRDRCGVDSRKQINLDPKAAAKWEEIEARFSVWLKAPQHA